MDRRPKCNMNCCVFGCHSKKGRSREISFHLFPKLNSNTVLRINKLNVTEAIDRRKAWELALSMGKPVTDSMRVCSLHFTNQDFIIPGNKRKFPRLRKTAVPTRNLPLSSFSKLPKQTRRCRKLQQSARKSPSFVENLCTNNDLEFDGSEKLSDDHHIVIKKSGNLHSLTAKEREAVDSLLELCNTHANKTSISQRSEGVQVKSGDLIIPFISIIHTDSQLNSLTGLCSFNLLEAIIVLINKYFPPLKVSILTVKEKIILTSMKLKMGITYAVLAIFFKITGKSCKRIFHGISKLATVLRPAIYWPSSDNNRKNMAKCFGPFDNVRVILDCTEIPLQLPKCLCCRVMTYSHYYGTHTVKFMTGISPSGLITFVSKGYGGRASDKVIFEQSKLIEQLEKGRDAIMVDKGYLIEDLTSQNFIKLIRPPFLRDEKQLSKSDALLNVQIARARVHVERSNQRIKIFEIFTKKLPWTLIKKIDDIFIVICAVVNLSAPILDETRF